MERGIFKLFEKLFIKYINMIDIKDKKIAVVVEPAIKHVQKIVLQWKQTKKAFYIQRYN